MPKFERKVISVQPPHAQLELEKYSDYAIVSVTPVNNRLVFILEKEKGPGRPKKDNGKAEE
jgi:hypothetical protein